MNFWSQAMVNCTRVFQGIPANQRHQMIAEAAYYLAEHRGFQGGSPVDDWLKAEGEISRLFQSGVLLRDALVFLGAHGQKLPVD